MSKNKKGKGGDYDVGYGKPPKHTRWKKGQSGNPGGRPRRGCEVEVQTLRQMREAFIRAANRQVTVTDNGTKIRMAAIDASFHRLIAKALSGDYRSIKLCHDWLRFDINEREEWQIRFAEMLWRSEE